ncbi:MAG: protein-L-isoaspartate O-methyltransferase [Herbinix sp.]|nr:protein-L-isoaspartate O-methyltransferase [Herbinix sp.]
MERPLERYLPQILKGFLKPLLSIVIVLPVTFLVFGPVGSFIGNSLANAYSYAYHFSPILAGFCLGLAIQPMVIFGLQWGIMPVIISNFALYGFDTILPFYGPPVMGQAGAAFAVSLLTKNKRMKSIATSGVITAFLGATEPILFGVTVPLKRPLLAACIAGGIGSGIIGTSHATATAFAFPAITTLVVYFGDGFWTYVIANILAFIIGFILTLIFKFKDIVDKELEIEG